MSIKSVYSAKRGEQAIVEDIQQQLHGVTPNMVLYFVSATLDQAVVAREMKRAFPSATTFGCSSAGEMVTGKVLENSVVAMAFTEETLEDVAIEIVPGIKEDDGQNVEKAFRRFEAYYNTPSKGMDFEHYLGFVLFDWMSQAEEKTMATLSALTNVGFIGCSAADNLAFQETFVHVEGKVYQDIAVLVLVKPKRTFHFVKTQNFCPTGRVLKATKADPETRTVLEFDGKPAATAYAEALGVDPEHLSDAFFENPVGLVTGDDFFVRSPQKVEGSNVVFYCNILENQQVHVLNATDIIADTKGAFDAISKEVEQVAGVIDFHCILRTLDIRNKNLGAQYGDIFKSVPMIGLASYGQQFIGHIDQTSMLLVFE